MKPLAHSGLAFVSFALATAASFTNAYLGFIVQTAIMFISLISVGVTVVGIVSWLKRIGDLKPEQTFYLSWVVSLIVGLLLVSWLWLTDGSIFSDSLTLVDSLVICFMVVISTDRYYSFRNRDQE